MFGRNNRSEGNTKSLPCRFYAQGTCRNGNSCRFSHSGAVSGSGSSGGGSNSNHGSGGDYGFGNSKKSWSQHPNQNSRGNHNNQSKVSSKDFHERQKRAIDDLTIAPIWPLSGFSCSQDVPNIVSGDLSQEEARLEAYQQIKQVGNLHQYNALILQMKQNIDRQKQQILQALNDPQEARRILDSQNSDQMGSNPPFVGNSSSSFTPTTSAFGTPSTPFGASFGNQQRSSNPFATASTTVPTTLAASPFSSSSSSSVASTPSSSLPLRFGSGGEGRSFGVVNPFANAKTSTVGAATVFGASSAPSIPTTVTLTGSTTTAFGQPSTFGLGNNASSTSIAPTIFGGSSGGGLPSLNGSFTGATSFGPGAKSTTTGGVFTTSTSTAFGNPSPFAATTLQSSSNSTSSGGSSGVGSIFQSTSTSAGSSNFGGGGAFGKLGAITRPNTTSSIFSKSDTPSTSMISPAVPLSGPGGSAAGSLSKLPSSNADASKIQSIEDEDQLSFQADKFTYGKVPINAPSPEVC